MHHPTRLLTTLLLSAAALLTPPAHAAPGDLDATFGTGGKVLTPIGSASDVGYDMEVQSDGKIVVAGYSVIGGNNDFAVVRYNANGTLDSSFGTGGIVTTAIGSGADIAYGVTVQSDGKIVAAGRAVIGTGDDFAVVRYTSSGALDASFGTGGKVTTDLGGAADAAEDLVIQPDGKIVLAGRKWGSNIDFAVVRYNSDGSLDSTFGSGGKATVDYGTSDQAKSIALQSDGKIVLAGWGTNLGQADNVAVVRLTSAGVLDTSFGTGGIVINDLGTVNEGANDVVVLNDGRIVVAGWKNRDFAMLRFTSSGALDTSFGGSGIVITSLITDYGNQWAFAFALRAQSDGKTLVAGSRYNGSYYDFVLVRYLTNGTLDSSFNGTGSVVTPVTATNDEAFGLAVQSDGKVLLAGYAHNGANNDFAVVRYEGGPFPPVVTATAPTAITTMSGTLNATINPNGSATTAQFQYGLTTSYGSTASVTLSPNNGSTAQNVSANLTGLTPGTLYYYRLTATNAIGTSTVNGTFTTSSLDPSFSGDGIQITPFAQGGAQARDVVVQADGKTVVAGLVSNAGQNDSLLARYLADGTLDTTFGTGGTLVLDLAGSGRHDLIFSIALQSDGKILVGGRAHNGTNYDFLAARFLVNGTLDTSFDGDGKAITPMGTGDDTANDVTVQSDGKVILAGSGYNGTNDDFAVVRYLANGSLDTSFDGDGKVLTPIGAGHESADAVAVQADGRIITSGYANNGSNLDIALVRYQTNGSLDTSLNGTGKVTTPVGTSDDVGIGMALQPDGKIVVTGYSFNSSANADFALLRYNASGGLDTSFNVTGKFTTAFGSGEDVPYAVAVQPDGRIVATGYTFNGSNSDMAVLRVNADGSLDTTFDGDGKLTLAPGPLSDRLYGVALAPDGAIVGAGFSDSAGGVAQVAVVRLIGGPNDLLVNGSFESQEAVGPNGAGPWPVGYGDWGGDQAAIVTAENGITPYAGSRMLKFVATGAGGAGAGGGSETTQLVDLTPWTSQIAAGQLSVGVTMRVNRVAGNASSDTKFVVALGARSGTASSFTLLTSVDQFVLSDNNPSTWELVSGTLLIPTGTTHLEVNLQAVENIVNDSTAPEFDGHYMDDARLTLNFAPDIQVEQPVGTILVDGTSTVAFSTTPLGTPVTKTFRVTNTGGQTLNVTGLTLPFGYEVVGGFTPYALAPSATQTFDVRFLANTVPGTFNGTLTLTSDDPDTEGSFAVGLTGRAALVYPGAMAIKTVNPSAPDGVYTLDPDGPGGADPFDAYCDMTTNGGGWTLLLKANGSLTTFQYSSALWTNTTTLNPGSPGLDTTEFKSQGFSTIPFNGLMVGLGTGRLQLSLPGLSETSLRAMFSGGSLAASNSRAAWLALTPNPGNFDLMGGAQLGGVNMAAGVSNYVSVRVGMHMNNEADLATPDAYVGIGASSWNTGVLTTTAGSSNYLAPPVHYPEMGYIYVRDTTPGAAPSYAASATTNAATTIGLTTATLNGTTNPNGVITNAWFQYGLTTSYGSTTSNQPIGYGTSAVPVTAALSSLTPGTLYHYRLVAQNGVTTAYGADMTFTTLPGTNANLASLTLGSGTLSPAFASGTLSYTATVANSVSSVSFTAVTADANATLGGSSSPMSLNLGPNTLTVLVTAPDNLTTRTYTVIITRQTPAQSAFDTSYGIWAAANGLPTNAPPAGDLDGDGKTNLEEFAFGTDPASNTSGPSQLLYAGSFTGASLTQTGQPVVGYEPSGTGVDYRAVFIRRADHATAGLTYAVQFSANMTTWHTSSVTPSLLHTSGGHQLVSVKYPLFVGGRPARFFRIVITAP